MFFNITLFNALQYFCIKGFLHRQIKQESKRILQNYKFLAILKYKMLGVLYMI